MLQASRFFAIAALLSLWACGVLPARGQSADLPTPPATAPQTLTTFESRNYTIHTNAPLERVKPLAEHMDVVFDAYERMLAKLDGKSRRQHDLYLLDTREDYIALMATKRFDASASGGVYFRREDENGLATWVSDRAENELLGTLQHEGFHQFADFKSHGNLPLWVNEGLAEYFSDAIVVGGRVRHGIVDDKRLQRLRAYESQQAGLAFDDLLNITPEQWKQHMLSGQTFGRSQYDQSWSIVHFLIHADKRYEQAFSQYLILLSKGQPHRSAFEKAFGSNDTTQMQRRYQEFLARLEPDAYSAALTRMRFLAQGMRYLKAIERPIPDDFNQFRSQLRDLGFRTRYGAHGVESVLSSEDVEMFWYDTPREERVPFVLQPHPQPGMPPRILAGGLTPPAYIDWLPGDDEPQPVTRFEAPRRK